MTSQQNSYGYLSSPYGASSAAPRRPADAQPRPSAAPERDPYGYGYGARGDGYSENSYSAAPRSDYRSAPPKRPAPSRPASAPRGRSVDMFVLLLMLIVGPLCGVLGVFLRPMLWVFLIVEGAAIALMWAFKCYLMRGRVLLTCVLLVLMTLALLAGVDVGKAPQNYQSYGGQLAASNGAQPAVQSTDTPWGGVSGVGLGGLTSEANATTEPVQDEQQDSQLAALNLEGAQAPVTADNTYGDAAGADVAPVQVEATESPMTGVLAAAESVMKSYMQCWQQENWESMVQYVTPTWRSAQTNPQLQLYWNHGGIWTLNNWTMTAQNAQLNADSITFSILADLSKSTTGTKITKRYEGIVIKDENGTWYVDPDSMRTGVEVKETASDVGAANAAAVAEDSALASQVTVSNSDTTAQTSSVNPNMTLWYNSKGGTFYHLKQKCESIGKEYYDSMKSFTYGELNDSAYAKLKPCKTCDAPARP